MKTLLTFFGIYFIIVINSFGQDQVDYRSKEKIYTTLEEALKNPNAVFKLNLSNQDLKISHENWLKFKNLEYLKLTSDHLKSLPKEILELKNLKTLDISSNDFETLPDDFAKLENLEELYLNDEKKLNLPKTLKMLSKMPKLKSLHLENDNLTKFPIII